MKADTAPMPEPEIESGSDEGMSEADQAFDVSEDEAEGCVPCSSASVFHLLVAT